MFLSHNDISLSLFLFPSPPPISSLSKIKKNTSLGKDCFKKNILMFLLPSSSYLGRRMHLREILDDCEQMDD